RRCTRLALQKSDVPEVASVWDPSDTISFRRRDQTRADPGKGPKAGQFGYLGKFTHEFPRESRSISTFVDRRRRINHLSDTAYKEPVSQSFITVIYLTTSRLYDS